MLYITLNPVTLDSIYHSTFLCDGVLIFCSNLEVLNGAASFEMYLYPMFTGNVFKNPTESSSVWYYYIRVVIFIVVSYVVAIGVFGVVDTFVVPNFSLLRA